MFTRRSIIDLHYSLKNTDVKSLVTQDVKLIERNLHNAPASILPIYYPHFWNNTTFSTTRNLKQIKMNIFC